MKKIFFGILILLSLQAYAIRAVTNEEIYKELGVSNKQKAKIEQIKGKYQEKRKPIFEKMRANITSDENKKLGEELYKLHEEEQREIMRNLNYLQKLKYKEIQSRVY